MKQTTSWGAVADWYKSYLDNPENYHSKVILPHLTRLIGITPGMQILDLACGAGFFSELFHSSGAQVTGVDISRELIAIARKNASSEITFIATPAHKLEKIPSESMDVVSIVLAIQNIREVKEMLQECKRVLKKQGRMYVVMNHPAFRIPGGSSWGFDEQEKKQYRRIDQYLSEKKVEISMHPGQNPSEKTISFHRPLQYYFKIFSTTGFAVTRLEEWISHKSSQQGPRQKEEDRMRKEIPLFLALELRSV